MTWLGKILTIVVFLGALVWAYFTVQSYVLSTNWRLEAEKYKKAYEEARAKRQTDYDRYLVAEDALRRQVGVESVRAESLGKQLVDLTASSKKAIADLDALQAKFDSGDGTAKILQANLDATTKELKDVRDRNFYLEDDRVRLVIAAEDARRAMVTARNSERLAQAIADDNAKKVEDLQVKVSELRQYGTTGAPSVLRAIEKPPPSVLPNLRGEVTDVAGDLLTISVGIDAGLGVGTTLDIYRTQGGARYLGTVKVTSAYNLYPKQAVVTFTPASRLPLERLLPEDLPKKGDLVRPLESGR